MERDKNGRRTHYYYWSANRKKIDAMIKPMLDKVRLAVRKDSGVPELRLHWATDSIPHPILAGTPKVYIFHLRLLDERGRQTRHEILRFYNEVPEDDEHAGRFREKNPTGALVSLAAGETYRTSFKLSGKISGAGAIRLEVYKKPQYWNEDSAAVLVYRREEPYRL